MHLKCKSATCRRKNMWGHVEISTMLHIPTHTPAEVPAVRPLRSPMFPFCAVRSHDQERHHRDMRDIVHCELIMSKNRKMWCVRVCHRQPKTETPQSNTEENCDCSTESHLSICSCRCHPSLHPSILPHVSELSMTQTHTGSSWGHKCNVSAMHRSGFFFFFF